MVAEVEVEQSSSCHVRDVGAAEQNTLIIATATTLHPGCYCLCNLPEHLLLSL
jgi:hypothetical protein